MVNQLSKVTWVLLFLTACNSAPSEEEIAQWKQEVADAERTFCEMAQKEGITKAFEFYAADDGVIRRRKKIVKGKEAIREWYQKDVQLYDTLRWEPTFIDVSKSGDLAYTYGNFTFTYLDTLGNQKKNTGIFHTVWKRQADGNWRFVWD